MNSHDEELQRKVEQGQLPPGESLDVQAYERVFRSLKSEPGFELSPRFAETVAARLMSHKQSRITSDYFWYGAGIFFLLMTFIATVLFTGFQLDFGFLNMMSDYKGLAVFGVVFIIFLHWLDKRIIRRKHAEL